MINRVLLLLFFVVLALDFRGEQEGGGVFQYLIVGCSGVLGCALVGLNLHVFRTLQITTKRIVVLFFGVVIMSVFVYFKNGVVLDAYIRVVIPVFLGSVAFFAVAVVARSNSGFYFVIKALLWAAAVSAVWRFFYAFYVVGLSVHETRYQILSHGTLLLFGFSLYRVLFGPSFRLLWGCVLAVTSALVVLSITRTHLLAAVVMLVAGFWVVFSVRGTEWANVVRVRFLFALAALSTVAIFVVLPATVSFRPEVLQVWSSRLLETKGANAAIDPTAGIRIAQIIGQLKGFNGHELDALFGRGFGAPFYLDTDFMVQYAVSDSVREQDLLKLRMELWQNPDSTYVPALFSGGLLFLFLIVYMFWAALRPLFLVSRFRDRVVLDAYGPLAFCIIHFFVYGYFGNFFLDRFGAVVFSTLIALALVISKGQGEANGFMKRIPRGGV